MPTVKLSKAFTFFAASYFVLVFLKDGTAVKLIGNAADGAKTLAKGGRGLTRLT